MKVRWWWEGGLAVTPTKWESNAISRVEDYEVKCAQTNGRAISDPALLFDS
jgi:hypothetical protein